MAELTGNDVTLDLGGSELERHTEFNVMIDGEVIETSNMTSGKWREIIDGKKDLSIDVSGRVDQSDTNSIMNIMDELMSGNAI